MGQLWGSVLTNGSFTGGLTGQMSTVLKVEMSPFVGGLTGGLSLYTVKNRVHSIHFFGILVMNA